jgi:hypothetical protein
MAGRTYLTPRMTQDVLQTIAQPAGPEEPHPLRLGSQTRTSWTMISFR